MTGEGRSVSCDDVGPESAATSDSHGVAAFSGFSAGEAGGEDSEAGSGKVGVNEHTRAAFE